MSKSEATSETQAARADVLLALVRLLARQAARESHSELAQHDKPADRPTTTIRRTEPLGG